MMADVVALHLAVAVVVAAPLLYAATSKLVEPSRFAAAIPRFGLGFLRPSASSAQLVALLELAGGSALLVFPVATTGILAGILYLVFAVVLVRAQLLGTSGDCGCFGAIAGGIDRRAVVRNVMLALGSFTLSFARSEDLLAAYEWPSAALGLAALTLASAVTDMLLEFRQNAT